MDVAYLDIPEGKHSSKPLTDGDAEDLAEKLEDMGFEVEFGYIESGFAVHIPGDMKPLIFNNGYRFILKGKEATSQILEDIDAPKGSRLYQGSIEKINIA